MKKLIEKGLQFGFNISKVGSISSKMFCMFKHFSIKGKMKSSETLGATFDSH